MPALYHYRLFISHAWKYGEEYSRLITLLNNAPNFSYYNYSAPEDKPLIDPSIPGSQRALAQAITNKIRPAQIVVVLSGMYEAYHSWMQYEVDQAYLMGKPILAISPWGNQRTPAHITQRANKIVNWNTSSIVSAIRELV